MISPVLGSIWTIIPGGFSVGSAVCPVALSSLLARESELARSLTCPKHPVMKVTVSAASPNLIWNEVVFMSPP